MSSDCEHREGCGCSQCLSPDVTTELISVDPWEIGFASLAALYGTSTVGGPPLTFTFTIYPGIGLPYARVFFETDEDWPDGSVFIYDEDGNEIFPWTILTPPDEGQELRIVFDPGVWEYPGAYRGQIVLDRGDNAGGWIRNTDNDREKEAVIELEETVENRIAFNNHNTLIIQVAAAGSERSALFDFHRVSGTADLYWRLFFTPDAGWVGTYPLVTDGAIVDPDTIYGPLAGATHQLASITVDPTLMIDGESYTGTLTVRGYLDAAGTELVNEDTKLVQVNVGAFPGARFDVTVSADPIDRGTQFDIQVTAVDTSDDTTLTDYEGGNLNINLTCIYTPTDAPVPLNFASQGLWTNGVCDIPDVIITGGTGAQIAVLQIYDQSTGVYGFVTVNLQTVAMTFTLTVPESVQRDIPFDLVIQASNPAYVPAGNVNIALNSDDENDTISPLFTNNVGWVAGAKTVACTITGGDGEDSYEIIINDPNLGISGVVSGTIRTNEDVAWGSCDPPMQRYYKVTFAGLAGDFAFANGEHIVHFRPEGAGSWRAYESEEYPFDTNRDMILFFWDDAGYWYVYVWASSSTCIKQWRRATFKCHGIVGSYTEISCNAAGCDASNSCTLSAGATCSVEML